MSKNEFIEENYKELRAFVYASYKKTILTSFYEFDDFFNNFIIYLLKYDNLKEEVGFWKCIRKQIKSFIMNEYKSLNTQKRKANDNYYKVSIDEFNEAHANDILCSYSDELNLKLELSNLTPDEINVFVMKVEGYTFDNRKEMRNKSFKKVKTTFYKTRKKLKEEYKIK